MYVAYLISSALYVVGMSDIAEYMRLRAEIHLNLT